MKIEEILRMRDRFKDYKFVEKMINKKWQICINHNNEYDRYLTTSYLYGLYDRMMYKGISHDYGVSKDFFWMTNAESFHRILSLYRESYFMPLTMKDNNIYFLDSPVIFASVYQDTIGRIYLVDALGIRYNPILDMIEPIDDQPYYGAIEDLM